MQSFSARGLWWLPELPDDEIAGTLDFSSDGGATLELLGLLGAPTELPARFRHELQSRPVIHGLTTSGEQITLLECMAVADTIGTGVSTSRYKPGYILRGAHVRAFGELRVSQLVVSFDHLADWYGPKAIRRTWTDVEGGGTSRGLRVEVSADLISRGHPDSVVSLPFGEIELTTIVQTQFGSLSRVSLTQEVAFDITFREARSLRTVLHDVIYHLQNLITLGSGVPQTAAVVRVKINRTASQGVGTPAEEERSRFVEVVFETTRTAASPSEASPRRHQMPFTFADIRPVWGTVLARLFETAERIRPVYELYFAAVYSPHLYLQNRFLNFAQAAESLHRTMWPVSPPLSPELFAVVQQRVAATLSDSALGLPTSARRDLISRASFWNQPSLRRRLRELVVADPELRDVLKELVEAPKVFCDVVVGTRNYLTHYDPNDSHHVRSLGALFRLTEQLGCLLQVHFMHLLGVPRAVIERHTLRRAREISQIETLWEDGE
jgi:hypothetical protein